MADSEKKEKKKLEHKEEKKSSVSVLLIGMAFFLIFFIIATLVGKETEEEKKIREDLAKKVTEPKFSYCWTDAERSKSRCGRVEKISFANGQIETMQVYFVKTGVITHFWKAPNEKTGVYSQKTGKGTWFLEKASPGKYIGWELGDEKDDTKNVVIIQRE